MTRPPQTASPPEGDPRAALVRVREFVWEDLSRVLELWKSAGPGIHLGPSDTPDELRKKWMQDPDLFLVAEAGRELVAAVVGGFDGRRGIVYHLAVAEAWRRRGIGRRMMDELESRLRARGCLKSYLLAAPENQDAVAFYRGLGWEVMDMVLMGKEMV